VGVTTKGEGVVCVGGRRCKVCGSLCVKLSMIFGGEGSAPWTDAGSSLCDELCECFTSVTRAENDVRGEVWDLGDNYLFAGGTEKWAGRDYVGRGLQIVSAWAPVRVLGVRAVTEVVFACEGVFRQQPDCGAENWARELSYAQHEVWGLV
jgi:hypothetical protein